MNWVWTSWLIALIVSFGCFEGYALAKGKTTLSRYTWNIFKVWPPIAVVFGMLFGGLAVHFFWHWCPT